MLLHVRQVLGPDELREARRLLAQANWVDGRLTAGEQSARAKQNEQLPEMDEACVQVRRLVLRGLDRHAQFFSAALPSRVSPPLVNRYGGTANRFGNHVDGAMRALREGGRVRTDLSCTVFLSDPADYDGGELVIVDTYGEQRVKLPAGDMVLYPGTSVHRVEPVTRGHRVGAYFWVQSMVRSDEQRRLLFDMDQSLMHLRASVGEADPGVIGLTGTYHNLLRMWADA
ncbi:Fe2+-dependent dioxygenase [Piscinibacter sakaiensis]|uniref:Iron-uptake factor PiuC n=1 Tax=Piscinibacter sakaiensis TaxID=1547922 RepID=A0A0K8NYX7_PISS1|nr:Fe2+-dependent dioxygenase [Piscinibacter sakaiensis]GAP35120.1 iron-uptake factor PiuC [Piscinibacter sakaiensis]